MVDSTILLGAVQGLLGILWGIMTWNFIDVKKRAEKASEDLAAYKIMVAEKYVTAESLDKAVNNINIILANHIISLDKRFDKMEGKIDRLNEKE